MSFADHPETGDGLGAAYIEFSSSQEAKKACAALDNYKLDKKHTFKMYPLSIFDDVLNTANKFTPSVKNDSDNVVSCSK